METHLHPSYQKGKFNINMGVAYSELPYTPASEQRGHRCMAINQYGTHCWKDRFSHPFFCYKHREWNTDGLTDPQHEG